jgi:multimeric flavodoxin WrbA
MKVLTLLGSPRKTGNTATVLAHFEKLISRDHQVQRVTIIEHEIRGCLGCGACQPKPDEPGCVQKDDGVSILNQIIESDLVIYATPLYCWCFSSQMKALLDRHYCLVTDYGAPQPKSLLQGKPIALLVTCAGPIDNNADLIQSVFDRVGEYAQCQVIGKYIVPFCTTPEAIGPEAEKVVEVMARDIASM